MNEDILRFDDPPENQNGGEEDILYFDDVKDNQDDEDILYFDDVEETEKFRNPFASNQNLDKKEVETPVEETQEPIKPEVSDKDRVYEDQTLYISLDSPITPEIYQTDRGNFYLKQDNKNYKVVRTKNKDLINFDPLQGREVVDVPFETSFEKDLIETEKRAKAIEEIKDLRTQKAEWEKRGFESAKDYYEYLADEDEGSQAAYRYLATGNVLGDMVRRTTAGLYDYLVKGPADLYDMVELNYMAAMYNSEAEDWEKQYFLDAFRKLQKTEGKPIDDLSNKLKENFVEYDNKSITEDILNGDYGMASLKSFSGIGTALPSIILAYSGLGGIAVMGASSTGLKFDELMNQDSEDALDMITLNSIGTGITEAAFELVTRGILKRGKELFGKGSSTEASKFFKSYTTEMLKRLGLDPAKEGVSEFATAFTTGLIDFWTLEEYDDVKFTDFFKENWKNWYKEGEIGFLAGGGITAVNGLSSNKQSHIDAAVHVLTPESDKKTINDAALKINELNKQLKEVYNKEDSDIIEAKIMNEQAKIIKTKIKVKEELDLMTKEELTEYASNKDKINRLGKRKNSNIPYIRDISLQELSDLELQNEALIREAVDRRLDENIKTVGVEDLGRTVNDYNSKEEYQKAYNNTEEGKKNSMNVTSSDGFISEDGDIYINREVAQKVRNVNVAAHELLHGILNNNIKEPGQLKKLVNEFKAILPKDVANKIQKRIDDNYRFTTDEQGNRVERPESEYMEEYFTAFADLIGNRQIKFNENIFTKIGEKITPIFKGKGYGHIKFETGKDVYNFIKDYQKQIAKGELKPETIEVARKVAEQDIDTKFSKTEEDRKIKDIFDEFTGPAENRKFKSKEEFKNSPEYFNALLEIEQSNTLDASIRNTVGEAYLNMNPGFVKQVKERIGDKYQSEYDVSKNSLFGWLMGKNISGQPLINLASGDIQAKISKQPRTVTTTKKVGGEDSKVTIAETLVSDEISPEEYADMQLAKEKLEKIEPQQSRLVEKLNLTKSEVNLAKRDIIGFLRKTDRPAMTDPKKFFKAFVDYTTGSGVQPGGFAKVIYDKLSLPKDGRLSTKNRKAFIKDIAEDLIALNKVDPAVMRRSNWKGLFYDVEIENMSPTQTQKAIDEGRVPSTTNLKSGLDLFKTLNPSVDQVVDYLMKIRPDVFKRKMPKFLGEVIVKNEFNEILENPIQPIYDAKGNKTDNTIDLSKSITEEEVVRGAPKVIEKIARPKGVKFSLTTKKDLNWKTDEAGNMTTSFGVNNKKYNIELYPVDNKGDYRLNFNLETKNGTTREITATGDSFKVFSIVYNGVVEEIESNLKIKSFQFEADKSEPTRVKLYTTLMDKLADRLGWESDIYETTDWDGGGSFDFELVKPKIDIKFSKSLKDKVKKAKAERSKTKTAKEKEGINAEIERQYGGALDKTNPDDFEKFEKDIIDIFADELGPDIFSYITSQTIAAAGNNAFGSKPGRGAIGAGFFYISEFGGEKKPTAEKTGETASMLEAGYIGEIKTLETKIKDKYQYKKPLPKDRIYIAKTQTLKNLEYNKENLSLINKEKRNRLDKWKKIYDDHPKSRPSIKEFQYNNNANAAVSKNEALVLDSMDGSTEFNKYEEHGYQHGEYSLDKAKAMSSKVDGVWENWKDYAEKEYKQMVFNKTNRIKSIKGDMRTYQGIVDLTYNLPEYGEWKAKSEKYPLVSEMMDIAMKTGKKSDWDKVPPASDMRFFNEKIKLNPFILKTFYNGKTIPFAEKYNLKVPKKFQNNPNVYELVSDLIFEINKTKAGKLTGDLAMKSAKAQDIINDYLKTAPSQLKAAKFSKSMLNDSKVLNLEGDLSMEDLLSKAATLDNALANARKLDAPVKKIRVFDFDDTLARTKSIVFYTKPDGTEGQLTAEQFAEKGADLVAEGAVMDFSDFNIVREGTRGPLFDVAKKIKDARGNEDLFVLTARAPESADAIYEFLKSEGLEFKRENIVGLGNSTGAAKANWIVDKAADGYNDFYFADDAYANVQAVQDALDQIDVKSKVQQAKVKFSKSINEDFNKIIEQKTGIASEKRYSKAKAKVRGANKGNKKFFIPYSAEDFMGLVYPLLSKGKLGDSQMAWFKEHLLDPYGRAIENLSSDRIQMMQDFKQLKKSLEVPKDLRKTNDSGFTNEQAVRVYLFNKMGYEVPGLSKTDLSELVDIVNSDGKLKAFADQILSVTKGDGYVKPSQEWLAGTITTDLIDLLNTTKRRKYLEQSGYLDNANEIFSTENLNKLEAAYGAKYREAVENTLSRMKSGKNRMFSGNRLSNRVLDYINGSIGTIMFFNTRSAVLQTISAVNFLNWSFNNPYKAGKAFANQPQYWKDFKTLMNSDYLTDRRNGLKLNISENEIANAAATAKNKARGAMNYILQKGYLPTQFADSFAIASGGATFYRNRINDLVKQGIELKQAEQQALSEWKETAEISQQSSDPSKISQQQASDLGRVILAFANTPMQYARIQKRAFQDIVNKRGDAKTHVSKIIYYGVVQNLIFNALQQALFAIGFGDDEDEENEKKYLGVANGMLDSTLRGLGIAGATVAVIKNFLMDIYERSDRPRPEYVDAVYKLLQLSPPISSKISKIRQAAYQFDSKKRRQEIFEKGFSLDNPAYEAAAKVISATTNLPLDRVLNKVNNIEAALGEDAETWQIIAMLAGWPEWQIMAKEKKKEELPKFEGAKVKEPKKYIKTFKKTIVK